MSEIAQELERNKSSISREIGGRPRRGLGKYNADIAHQKALVRISKRGNMAKTTKNQRLKKYIEDKMINKNWTPEQISLRLPVEYNEDAAMRISHEAVYQEVYRRVYRSGNGTVKPGCLDLRPHLTRRHKTRAKKGFRKAQRLERDVSLPSIEARPSVVAERLRIGDWEDDTMVSRSCDERIKSVTERKSGVSLFGKTKDGTADNCDKVLIERLSPLPENLRKTLTRDRGKENIRWQKVKNILGMDIFFAHSYCSYERGTNENTNGLFRRYFPKKTNWSTISDEEIARVEYLLNTRPRKRFNGLTPVEVFYKETGVALYG